MTDSYCNVPGCESEGGKIVRGMCNSHYRRWLRYGDPLAGRAAVGEPLSWLQSTVASALAEHSQQCIDWPYGGDQYGRVKYEDMYWVASRLSCLLAWGPPDSDDLQTAHACGRSICVNPHHLRWATAAENAEDRRRHGTLLIGSKCNTRLKEADVIKIRSVGRSRRNATLLAQHFGIAVRSVWRIWLGETWTWLPQPELTSDQQEFETFVVGQPFLRAERRDVEDLGGS